MNKYLSIGEVSLILGVSVCTLRRWDRDSYLQSSYRTYGNHRRYKLNNILKLINKNNKPKIKKIIGYSRVSSYDQKKDLKIQSERLNLHIMKEYPNCNHEIIEDLGSGLNYNKRGLKKLLRLICNQEITILILTHKDRLLRFGSEIIFELCKIFNITVKILDEKFETFEESLCNNILSIMTVFSAKLYGSRSHKNKRKIKELTKKC